MLRRNGKNYCNRSQGHTMLVPKLQFGNVIGNETPVSCFISIDQTLKFCLATRTKQETGVSRSSAHPNSSLGASRATNIAK